MDRSGQAAVEYVGLLLVVVAFVGLSGAGVAAFRIPSPGRPEPVAADADAILALPLADFRARAALGGEPFDWTDDGCSGPTPASWERVFRPACERHDFGYRNFGKGLRLRPTEAQRRLIDRMFLKDMRDLCSAARRWWLALDHLRCLEKAKAMHLAVRRFGRTAFHGGPAPA